MRHVRGDTGGWRSRGEPEPDGRSPCWPACPGGQGADFVTDGISKLLAICFCAWQRRFRLHLPWPARQPARQSRRQVVACSDAMVLVYVY